MQKHTLICMIKIAFILSFIQSIYCYTEKNNNDNLKNSNLIYLTIQFCQSWSYRSYFMEIEQIMKKNFKNVIVNGEEYPLTSLRKTLSYSIIGFQFLIFSLLILINVIKPILTSIFPNDIIDWIGENKLRTFFLTFVLGNFIQNQIYNTGAFEIFYNGQQIWSKLNTGNVPDINNLLKLLSQKGAHFIKI